MRSLGKKSTGARLERMQASAQWARDGGSGFRNAQPILAGLRDPATPMPSIGEFLCGGERRVPTGPLPVLDPRERWLRTPDTGLRATWLGHSSVLLEIGGLRFLTDPVWGPRASPSRLVGPKRFQPAAVKLAELPHIDAILLSHDHYDHLDYPTVRALAKVGVPFITSLGVGAHLEAFGVQPALIHELDWWESFEIQGVRVTAAPSQHFSGRGLKDRNATLWSSLVVRSDRHAVFFSGDTGLTEQFKTIAERLGPFDLILLEVGAHHPAWGDIHLGPHNALQAFDWLDPGRQGLLLPVHWGTFSLALHPWDEPAEVLLAEAGDRRLLMPRLGEAVEPAQAGEVQPWWRGVDPAGAGARPEPLVLAEEAPWPLD
jgi:L-ascorbate metabolism protein UlaG (beta-lactamase superfamily)